MVHFNGTEAQPANQPDLPSAGRLLATLGLMTNTLSLPQAVKLAEDLGTRLHGLRLPNVPRSRVAFACFAVAQQHHSAILILLDRENPLQATAFALLRPTLEATLRGEWVLHCATEAEIKKFALGGDRQVSISKVVRQLAETGSGADSHRILYKDLWPILSAYTHTYEHQVQHWLSPDGVAPVYAPAQTVAHNQ